MLLPIISLKLLRMYVDVSASKVGVAVGIGNISVRLIVSSSAVDVSRLNGGFTGAIGLFTSTAVTLAPSGWGIDVSETVGAIRGIPLTSSINHLSSTSPGVDESLTRNLNL